MTSKLFASALIATIGFAAAPAFADNISGEVGYVPPTTVATSNVTREDVRTEYLQAQRSDALLPTGEGADVGGVALATAGSTLDRDAVRAQAIYAVQHGEQLGGRV